MDSDDEAVLLIAVARALGIGYRVHLSENAVTVEWL